MGAPLEVLVVDDEKHIRVTLATALEAFGCRTTQAESAEAARRAIQAHRFDLCFLDVRLGDADGIDLLPALLAGNPGLEVVVVTAFATVETAVKAIQRGARDYLAKPFAPSQVRHIVERARERRQLLGELASLRGEAEGRAGLVDGAVSPAMRDTLALVERAAPHDVPVLFTGENGTGKSLLARRLHQLSARAARPFVTVNCPTLSEELLASELFGHARGAFTGAVRDQPGKVEAADGGTLFLDEIAELQTPLQAKLLHFLQEKTFQRVGEAEERRADVRVIAATNRDLGAEVAAGRFREDLFYRLNTLEIRVPSLRERAADIPQLARQFLAEYARVARVRAVPELSAEAERALEAYGWPGNVRELKNAMERAIILGSGSIIGPELLPGRPPPPRSEGPQLGGDCTLEEIERAHLERVVARCRTQEEAARILGVDVSTLYRKRRRKSDTGD